MIRLKAKNGIVTYLLADDIKHVYVVLEMPDETSMIGEAKVHGVFANREHAEAQKEKLYSRHKRAGYVAVLKQKVRGV